jgi:tetratricopeptide (TPR) repeat protein
VALEDGTAPAQPVVIESKCSMVVHKEATTDKHGGFGFTLGQGRSDLIADMSNTRSAGSGLDAAWNDCTIAARLPGYTSDIIYVSQLPSNTVDLGVLTLHKAADSPMVSATSRKAPKDAVKALDKGREAAKNKKSEEAAKDFQKAVDLYPDYAEAWYELGQAQIGLKQPDEAHKSLEAAIKADGKYLPPYSALLGLESQKQNWKAVAEVADHIIELAPSSSPGVYFLGAAAQFRLQNLEAAEKLARAGIKMDEGHTQPRLFKALAEVLAARGDPAGAADQLKQYLEFTPFAPDADAVKAGIADLESRAAAQPKQ